MRIKCLVFKANETIVKVGDESDAMYFILKGCVEVVGPSGCVNAEISNGSFFGEVGVLLNMKRTASIRAKEECNIFILNKKDLDEVVKAFPFMQNVLNEAAEERFQLFTKRTKESESGENDQHVPDQFDMEVGAQSLAKLSLFKSVEKSVLSELSMRMQRKNWQSGENIINADEIGNSMFFLAAGKADVITSFGELIDSVSGPSAYFGEVAIIEQVPRTASIRCTSTCSTYELRKEDFMAVIAKYPDIAKQIKESADERMQNYLMRSVLA
ncbi:cyclic nucleotide-binding-like protein [Obelidium mucronatum]|nr:cyclic nucleotide-binding-like protein [Obelidium mucronatum]